MQGAGRSKRPLRRRIAGLVAVGSLAVGVAAAREMPFLPGSSAGVLAGVATSIAEGDFDLDGDRDLAATSSADEVVWVENAAGSWIVHSITTAYTEPDDIEVADVDCDGDPDVVFGSAAEDKLVWAENDGLGASWSLGALISGAASGIAGLAVGRVTADAAPDAMAYLPDTGEIVTWWRPGGCGGSVWSSAVAASGLGTMNEIVLADVTGDGRPDVVGAEYDAVASVVSYWENPGTAGAWAQTVVDGAFPDNSLAVAAGDVDGDGDADAAACALDGDLAWWANPGGAGAWAETAVGVLPGCRALELVDPDRDGDLDLLAASGAGTASWWDNESGDGTAWTARAFTTADDHDDVLVSDLDGDGDHDVAAADLSAGQLTLFENASSARSGELGLRNWFFYNVPTGGDLNDLAHADLNGDGHLDLVWVEQNFALPPTSSVVGWLEGFGAEPTVGVLSFGFGGDVYRDANGFPHSVALGDVDRDGDVDVLAGIEDDIAGNPVVCANSGATTPTWSCTAVGSGTFGTVGRPELADLDADGDLDFAAEFTDGGTIQSLRWWEQVGDPTTSGGWADHAIHAGPIDVGFRIEVADLDRDGDLDLVHNTDYGPGTGATWWRNDGGSPLVWTAQTIPDVDTGVFGLSTWDLGDIDRDGDLDVASRFAWVENQLPAGWAEHEVFPPGGPEHPSGASALADLDVDGDPDFVTLIQHHAPPSERLSWFENDVAADPVLWAEHPIEPFLAPGDPQTADFDRDGDPDLVIFDAFDVNSWVNAGGQFHLEAASVGPESIAEGVERALFAIDVEHRGRAGDEDLELAALSLLFVEETAGQPPLTQQQFDDLFEAVRVYRDDGSGTFVPGQDAEVGDFPSLAIADGEALLALADDEPDLQHAPEETPVTYFVTVELTATAAGAGIPTVTVTHTPGVPNTLIGELPAQPSAAENAAFDAPLLQEVAFPVEATFDVLESEVFDDGFESGDTSAWSQTVS